MPSRTRAFHTLTSIAVSAIAVCIVSMFLPCAAAVTAAEPAAVIVDRVQLVVDRLRGRLGIPESVDVFIEPQVPLVVSVEPSIDRSKSFRLAIEDRFLARLNDEELDAAVAHELGHVWVFTHYPYLQTERLANQIAMRIVTRDSLVSLYHKLWEQAGSTGDLEVFLGPPQ